MHDLEQWDGPRGAGDMDRFYQKQMIAGRLVELAPTAALEHRAIRIVIEGQRHAVPAPAWRATWLVPASGLVELARQRRELLDSLEHSGEPVLELYARLERLAPGASSRGD
jgi:hypothetical protein